MRLSPQTNKEDCHVIDFVDSANRVAGIASVPTLFGLDPSVIITCKSFFHPAIAFMLNQIAYLLAFVSA
jgi:hypothetical protein